MYYNFGIPNLDSEFKTKCIEWINNHSNIKVHLDSGDANLNCRKIIEMLNINGKYGNNYILLCGFSCYKDIIFIDNYKEFLKEWNIILLFDYTIPEDKTYLIPMKSYEPLELSEKIVLFTRA